MKKIIIICGLLACCQSVAQNRSGLQLQQDNFQIKNDTSFNVAYMIDCVKKDVVIGKPKFIMNNQFIGSIYITIMNPIPTIKQYQFEPALENFFILSENPSTREVKLVPQKGSNRVKNISEPISLEYREIILIINKIKDKFVDWPYYVLQVSKDKPETIHQKYFQTKNKVSSSFAPIIDEALLKLLTDLKKNYPDKWPFYILQIPGQRIPERDDKNNPIDATMFITYAYANLANRFSNNPAVSQLLKDAYNKIIELPSRRPSGAGI